MKRRTYDLLFATTVNDFRALLRELGEAGWIVEHFNVGIDSRIIAVIYREID